MRLVKTDEARVGQRVARDVVDLRGSLLFRAGTPLTAELLSACRDRSISHLFVDEEIGAAAASPADLELKRETISRDVDRMFRGVDSTPIMAALREASKRFLVAKLRSK